MKKVFNHRNVLILLVFINIYFFSFFFLFERASMLIGLPGDPRERKGPPGITVLRPTRTNKKLKLDGISYYFYYPVHKLLKFNDWAWTPKDLDSLMGLHDYEKEN